MSEINDSENNTTSEEDTKKKYYSEKRKIAMYKYRAKKTDAYLECRKRSNQIYYAKRKEMISKYKEIVDSGILEKIKQLEVS